MTTDSSRNRHTAARTGYETKTNLRQAKNAVRISTDVPGEGGRLDPAANASAMNPKVEPLGRKTNGLARHP